jgi:AcrR family transcriptional regulator
VTSPASLPGNDAAGRLRNLPMQSRAQFTLRQIEGAIRAVLSDPEIGRDRFTTNQVAQLAQVSIGTIYRYFPDRVAMLDHVWPHRESGHLPAEPDAHENA